MLKDLSLIIKTTASSIEGFADSMLYDCMIPEEFKQSVRKIDNASISYTNSGFIVNSSGLRIYFSNQLWYYAAACADLYSALSEYDNAVKVTLNIDREILKSCKDNAQLAKSLIPLTYSEQERDFLEKYLSNYGWWSGGKTLDRNDYYYSPIVSTCKLVNASQSYVAEMTRFLAGKPNERNLLLSAIPMLVKPKKTLLIDSTNIVEFMSFCVKEFLSYDRNMTMVKNFWKINSVTIGFKGCQIGKEKSAQDIVTDPRRMDDCDKNILWEVDGKEFYFWKEQSSNSLGVFAEQMNRIYENCYFIEVTDRYKLYKYTSDFPKTSNQPLLQNLKNTCLLQRIFYGAPGTGKSNTIKREVEDKERIHFRTTFHPDSDYSTFVGCYKPTMIQAPVRDGSGHEVSSATIEEKSRISYSFVPQAFAKAYCEAWNRYDGTEDSEPVFLIIEEINRGNCAQIFGDIFQLLDRKGGVSEYPIDADEDLKKFLLNGTKEDGTPWLTNKDGIKDGQLCLPPNLYIWATMNTSDQSLFPIDSAFKRRWDWKYVKIKDEGKNWTIEGGRDWWAFLKKINGIIAGMTQSADKQLGYYFCKPSGTEISAQTFVNKVCFYLWNDVFKNFGSDEYAELFKIKLDGKDCELTFPDFFDDNGNVNSDVAKQFIENVMKYGESQDESSESQEE